MQSKKGQKLTLCLISSLKDEFGVWEVTVKINERVYTYPLVSEFAIRKVENLIKKKKFGKAIQIMKKFLVKGFN